ncbi:hypothetical protein P4661_27465 [Priestia megaterium]|uniref:hypothetical protein n=1 Tax=Priestia megaterium TaxID=1404 RepID=UPI002E1A1E02|nr:hypothetical protein [Priestia megaterium]
MVESKRNDYKYKRDWRAAHEAGQDTEELKMEYIRALKSIGDTQQEAYNRIIKQIIAAIAAIVFASAMFGYHHTCQGEALTRNLFQIKMFYIAFAQKLAFPFSLTFLLIGSVHLKEKLYLSGPVIVLCSLVFLWIATHQI